MQRASLIDFLFLEKTMKKLYMFACFHRRLFNVAIVVTISTIGIYGCVAKTLPNGSTQILVPSVNDILGVNQLSTPSNQEIITNYPVEYQSNQINSVQSDLAQTLSNPSISTSSLAGIFTKHPYDGTHKTDFPRVAVTIIEQHSEVCWTAKAKIWWSNKKYENIKPFSVCWQRSDFQRKDAAMYSMFVAQPSFDNSGNIRGEGPKSPASASALPDNMLFNGGNSSYFVQQLIRETGWQSGAPMNMWVI